MKMTPVDLNGKLKTMEREMTEWRDHKELVLHELQRMNANIEKLFDTQVEQVKELSAIKTRSAVLGSLAGFSASIIMVIIDMIRK